MMTTQNDLIFAGVLLDIIVTVFGFVKTFIQYEHRFTKLETEVSILITQTRPAASGGKTP